MTNNKLNVCGTNDGAGIPGADLDEINLGLLHPDVHSLYERFLVPAPDNPRGLVWKGSTFIKILQPTAGGHTMHRIYGSEQDTLVAHAEQCLDTGEVFQAGKDYSVYLCAPSSDEAGRARLVISLNDTYPQGFTADNSRRIGGYHTLCSDVGTIAGHPLSGMVAGDILPASIWCLTHRPTCRPDGMVYVGELDFWADIYLQSGGGTDTASVYGGTPRTGQTMSQHVEDLFRVGKTPLYDEEFQCAAEGSNQGTSIRGGAAPVTTGGHVDTAGRRMISNYGLEDCCGVLWQWLAGWSHGSHQVGTYVPDGEKGQIYETNALLAGGRWGKGAICGSRTRSANNSRLHVSAFYGCRGRARNRAAR